MLPSQMLAMVELLFTDLVYRLTRLYHVCDTEACGNQRSGGKAVEGSTFEFHQLAACPSAHFLQTPNPELGPLLQRSTSRAAELFYQSNIINATPKQSSIYEKILSTQETKKKPLNSTFLEKV